MKVDYLRIQVGRATCEACSGNLEVSGTIPAFALVPRETKKNLCRNIRSQVGSYSPAFRDSLLVPSSTVKQSKNNAANSQVRSYIGNGAGSDWFSGNVTLANNVSGSCWTQKGKAGEEILCAQLKYK